MKLSKDKRFIDFKNLLSALRLDNFPIVVEGKRDTIALRKLQIRNPIIELNDGTSVLATIERIFQNYGSSTEFVILTDKIGET